MAFVRNQECNIRFATFTKLEGTYTKGSHSHLSPDFKMRSRRLDGLLTCPSLPSTGGGEKQRRSPARGWVDTDGKEIGYWSHRRRCLGPLHQQEKNVFGENTEVASLRVLEIPSRGNWKLYPQVRTLGRSQNVAEGCCLDRSGTDPQEGWLVKFTALIVHTLTTSMSGINNASLSY